MYAEILLPQVCLRDIDLSKMKKENSKSCRNFCKMLLGNLALYLIIRVRNIFAEISRVRSRRAIVEVLCNFHCVSSHRDFSENGEDENYLAFMQIFLRLAFFVYLLLFYIPSASKKPLSTPPSIIGCRVDKFLLKTATN